MNDLKIKKIQENAVKREIASLILNDLKEWFGIPESTKAYIDESSTQTFYAAFVNNDPVGFLSLKETSEYTLEIAVIGVIKDFRHQGIGKELFKKALTFAKQREYEFIQVKTVATGKYPQYNETNAFYKSVGFKEFELISDLWDEWNPCQIYIMHIKR